MLLYGYRQINVICDFQNCSLKIFNRVFIHIQYPDISWFLSSVASDVNPFRAVKNWSHSGLLYYYLGINGVKIFQWALCIIRNVDVVREQRPDMLRSKIILYKSGHSTFLGFICKVKENALCGDHINPSVCDLNQWTDLLQIWYVRYSLNNDGLFWF